MKRVSGSTITNYMKNKSQPYTENQSRALTVQQQTSILQLILAMFNASPGAVNLRVLGSQLMNDQSLVNLAQSLSLVENVLFFGKDYADLSPVEFAATFVDDLFGDRITIRNKTLIFDFIANQLATGVTQGDLISDLTGALTSIFPSDPNWGDAALHYNTHYAEKIVDHLLADTFTLTDKTIVVDHILTQMGSGKNFGAMVVWAINTLVGVDHNNPVWGKAAVLFNNRIEVSKYYSVDKASSAIDFAALQQILSRVTVDVGTVATAKTAIDNLLNVSRGLSDNNYKDFQLNKVLQSKKRNFSSMQQRISIVTELIS